MIPRVHLLMSIGLIFACLALSAGFFGYLPEQVPVHWDLHGEADRYGSRWEAAFLLPAILAGLALLLLGLPYLGPFRKNFEQFKPTYGRIVVLVMTAMTSLHVIFLLKSAGHGLPVGAAISVVLGFMMVALGNWLGKVRRNFYVGIRTPWTIANEVVWEKTHRVGSKLIMLIGLSWAVAGLTVPDWVCFIVVMSGAGVLAVWSLVYSYWCYRRHGQTDDLTA